MTCYHVRNNLLWADPGQDYGTLCQHLHIKELKEATYKDIAAKIDNDFLQQKLRADALEGVQLSGVQDKSLIFTIRSANYTENDTVYTNVFRFKEWDTYIDETSMTPVQRSRELMYKGNIELHCTCPSFLFWGYQFLLTQADAALVPEKRPPVKRNPAHRGIVCKHLHRTLKAFPFYTSDFARYIKENNKVAAGKDKTTDAKTKQIEQSRQDSDSDITYKDVM